MPRQVHIDQLKAKEQAAKAALEVQRKALQAAQAQRKAAEHKLLQVRWRDMGRLADQAGLGTLDMDVLPAAFAYLATVAQNPEQVACWRNSRHEHNGTRCHPVPDASSTTRGGRDNTERSLLPSFSCRETLNPGSEPAAHDRNLGREQSHGDVSV